MLEKNDNKRKKAGNSPLKIYYKPEHGVKCYLIRGGIRKKSWNEYTNLKSFQTVNFRGQRKIIASRIWNILKQELSKSTSENWSVSSRAINLRIKPLVLKICLSYSQSSVFSLSYLDVYVSLLCLCLSFYRFKALHISAFGWSIW